MRGGQGCSYLSGMWDPWRDPAVVTALIHESPDIIATLDLAGRVVEANPATIRLSGYSLDELRGLSAATLFGEEDLARLAGARARGATEEQISVTVRYRRKDGHERWLSARTMPLMNEGIPSGVLVFARDVTDEHERTLALRESNERFRSLVSAFDRAFFAVDPDLRVAGFFGRWIRSAGLESRDFIGRTPAELFPENGGEPHTSALQRVLVGEDVSYEWTYQLPRGDARRLRINASPMRDAQGKVIGIAGVAADITRRVQAEAEAEAMRTRIAASERTEALGKLVSGVAHELNNPLAAVLNFAEELILTEADPERRAALEIVRAQALRSRTIVRDLLTFARQGSHRPRTPTAPGPLIESVARALRPLITPDVAFDLTVVDGDTAVELDRAGFEQVLTNLVTNAAQAAQKGGAVKVEARRTDQWYEIEVRDNGEGIASEVLPRLFEPFFTTKPTGHGVGLGLSVSLGIVEAHGGTLVAGNVPSGEGRGAKFTVRLPISTRPITHSTPARGFPPVSVPLAATKPVLLIIDDEEPIRRALKRFFTRRGWEVEEASDGVDGLSRLTAPGAAERYTVVLCDLKMPGLDGPQLYEQVKERTPALIQRFIISTGDVTGDEAAEFLKRVATPVLEKPFELAAIAALAEQVRAAGR